MTEAPLPTDLDAGIFRAYDIRGITTENLTEATVYWIGCSCDRCAGSAAEHYGRWSRRAPVECES